MSGVPMKNLGRRVDIQNLLSLGDDLIGVLNNKKEVESLMQSVEGAKMLQSSCQEDSHEVQYLLDDYQKKITACQEKINKANSETIADAELEHLQNELEEKLQTERLLRQELRLISDGLDGLEDQRISLEERRVIIKKKEKDVLRAEELLSLCASVTSIIPKLDDETRIAGFIVDRKTKKFEKFELDPALTPYEACSRVWKMM